MQFRVYDTQEKKDVTNSHLWMIDTLGNLVCLIEMPSNEYGVSANIPGRYKVERLFLDNPAICKTPMYHNDRVLVKLPDEPLEKGRTFEGVIEFDEFDGRFYVDEYRNGKRGWDCHYVHGDMTIEVVGRINDEGISLD